MQRAISFYFIYLFVSRWNLGTWLLTKVKIIGEPPSDLAVYVIDMSDLTNKVPCELIKEQGR